MLSKSFFQFSVEVQDCVPCLLYDLRPNYGGGTEGNGTSFKKSLQALLHSVPPTLKRAITNPCLCQRLLDTPGQVWVSLLWGCCYFLLGPGAHKVLFVPSRSLFLQSCVSYGLMVTSSKRAYAIPRSTAPRALPLQQSTADPYLVRMVLV